MAQAFREDPLRNFRFRVLMHLPDNLQNTMGNMGFMGLSGIAVQNELIAYREGGWNTSPHKMIGQTDFAPITLTRGLFATPGMNVYDWQKWLYVYQWGSGNLAPGAEYRARDITVFVIAHPYTQNHTDPQSPEPIRQASLDTETVKAAIQFHNAWPGAFALTDLNAGDNGILIQQMTLHHEGWDIAFGDEASALIGASGAAA